MGDSDGTRLHDSKRRGRFGKVMKATVAEDDRVERMRKCVQVMLVGKMRRNSDCGPRVRAEGPRQGR